MLRSFKTEINPSEKQKIKIRRTIGTCRYVYNFYLEHNQDLHSKGEKFMSGDAFNVWLNNEYLPEHPELSWIKEVSSKSVKQAIRNAHAAFERFFEGKSGFPAYKKKNRSDVKMYFVRNNPGDCRSERHRIKIPTLGWVKLKEKGYIPATSEGFVVRSGTVSVRAGRYYVSAVVDVPAGTPGPASGDPVGIDLGLKELAVVSDGQVYKNINKTRKVQGLERQLKREQRRLSRKYENKKKGGVTQGKNIQKQKLKVQILYQRIDNIRTDYVNKTIAGIVRAKPSYITIEDLNVKGMMKNRHLSKAIASQKFYEFRKKLEAKCKENGIELRIADRFYPSSKMCHCCGKIKKDLKLSDRVYRCSCGYEEDRDLNAAMNLRDAKAYKTA